MQLVSGYYFVILVDNDIIVLFDNSKIISTTTML